MKKARVDLIESRLKTHDNFLKMSKRFQRPALVGALCTTLEMVDHLNKHHFDNLDQCYVVAWYAWSSTQFLTCAEVLNIESYNAAQSWVKDMEEDDKFKNIRRAFFIVGAYEELTEEERQE